VHYASPAPPRHPGPQQTDIRHELELDGGHVSDPRAQIT
jgi:hypothetical protein